VRGLYEKAKACYLSSIDGKTTTQTEVRGNAEVQSEVKEEQAHCYESLAK
jgi:hypothetical protein